MYVHTYNIYQTFVTWEGIPSCEQSHAQCNRPHDMCSTNGNSECCPYTYVCVCVCVCITNTYMLMEYTHKGYVGECREVSVQVDCVCAHYRRCSVCICLLDLRVFGRLRTYMKVPNVILNVPWHTRACQSWWIAGEQFRSNK